MALKFPFLSKVASILLIGRGSILNKKKYMAYHVLPVNDLKEHEESSTCACCPKLIIENGEMIFVHNSYDGREFLEPDHEEED